MKRLPLGAMMALASTLAGCAIQGSCGCAGVVPLPTSISVTPNCPPAATPTPAPTANAPTALATPTPVPATTPPPFAAVGPPNLTPTSCGFASPKVAVLFPTTTALVLCSPGPGCAQSFVPLSISVGYGTIDAASSGSIVGFGGVTDYQVSLDFMIDANAPGGVTLRFSDSAENLTTSVALRIVAAAANDGSLTVAGLPTLPCGTSPFSLAFTSTAPVSVTLSDPLVASISGPVVRGEQTSFTVTPMNEYSATFLTARAGNNGLIVPLNVLSCATPAERR